MRGASLPVKSGLKNRCALLFTALVVLMMAASPDAGAQRKKGRNKDKDSLLTLLSAEYARVFERPGHREFREVKGPATFLHNGAYMFCDSAIWNVSFNQLEAYENVKLVQQKTVLKSDNLVYYANDNLARFRGEVVEVYDKDKNTLRTRYLDYNTEDSVAKFSFGGAMRTSKGEIIESDRGTYDAKTGICRFDDNVEMFTDSLFIKTNSLEYDTNINKAYFGKKTQMWKNDVYMRGEYGWYAQDSGVVYFDTDVYMNNPDYEGWCDTLYYWQHTRLGKMRRNVELLDSLHRMYFVSDAGDIAFDSVNNIYATLFLDPASIYVAEDENHRDDTLFTRADTLMFYTQRACDVTDEQKKDSEAARQMVTFDAIGEADRKAAEKKEQEKKAAIEKLPEYIAYKKRQEVAEKKRQDSIAAVRAQREKDSLATLSLVKQMKADLDSISAAGGAVDSLLAALDSLGYPQPLPGAVDTLEETLMQPDDNLATPRDSFEAPDLSPEDDSGPGAMPGRGLMMPAADGLPMASADSLAMPQDSLAAPLDSLAANASAPVEERDTTQLRFLKGWRNAKIYRIDMQARCDSLYFSQIDTLIRMFQDPVIWNEDRHQLSAEEVILRMTEDSFDRANLHGNAMIVSQEDTLHFDQIKSTEMLGYFNSDNTLRRFDALGGVNAMFYMQEDSVITILNSKQAQFMMVTMKNGTAERIKYYESVNSDAFPVYNLPMEKQRLKGFKWRQDEQPKSRFDITRHGVRASKRASYAANKLPVFRRADLYYDNYMKDIYRQIEERAEQARLEQARRDSLEEAEQLAKAHFAADSTLGITSAFDKEGAVIIDSLATLKPAPDTASGPAVVSPVASADSLAAIRRQARLDSLAAERDAAKARLDSLQAAVSAPEVPAVAAVDSAASTEPVAVPEQIIDTTVAEIAKKPSDGTQKPPIGIEGIENHSDEGFVEVQIPKDGKKLTCKEKRALRKAARELRHQQKKLEREARRAEREAKRAAAKAEREARKAAIAAEKAAKKAAAEEAAREAAKQ